MFDWQAPREPAGKPGPAGLDPPAGSVEHALAWFDQWAADADDTIGRVRAVAEIVSRITAKAVSSRGEIEVTVGASGELADLRLDGEVSRWDTHELAAEIIRLSAEARGRLGEAAAAAVTGAGFDAAEAASAAAGFRPGAVAADDTDPRWGAR